MPHPNFMERITAIQKKCDQMIETIESGQVKDQAACDQEAADMAREMVKVINEMLEYDKKLKTN